MGTLGWYALTRAFAKFVFLLVILLGVLVGGQLVLVIGRGIPLETCVPILPSMCFLALTIALPLALSASVLVALGNMNRDGELRALGSCGISHVAVVMRLFPLLVAGVIGSAIFSNVLMPDAMGNVRANRSKMLQAAIAQRVAAHESIDIMGFDAWAGGADGQNLSDLFMFLESNGERTALFAERASWMFDGDDMMLQMPQVRVLHKSVDGAVTRAEIKNYQLQKNGPRKLKQPEPDSMQTNQLLRVFENLDPAKDREMYNNARLSLQLRLFTPLSLIAYVLFAAGIALAFAVDSLVGVGILVVLVAATTYPAIAYVKTQVDHPHMNPGWLLWPPVVLLAAAGCFMIWRPQSAGLLASRPLSLIRKLWDNRLVNTLKRKSASGAAKLADVAAADASGYRSRFGATLDRYVMSMTASRWLMALFIGVFLLILADFIGRMGFYVHVLGTRLWYLVPYYYLLNLPQFVVTWLPISVAAAALIIATPMLRQGGLMALSSSGVPPRRIFMGVLVFAALVGAVAFALKDQVVPRLVEITDGVASTMQTFTAAKKADEPPQKKKEKKDPNGWHSGDYFWCAQNCVPANGVYENVAVFRVTGDDRAGSAMADALVWNDGVWQMRNATVVNGAQARSAANANLEDLGIRLEHSRRSLALAIRPDIGKTSWELYKSAGPDGKRIMIMRIAAALLPILCLLFALPGYILWENRLRLGQTCAKSISLALLPVAAMGLLSKLLLSAPNHLVLISASVVGAMLAIGGWRWRTMRL